MIVGNKNFKNKTTLTAYCKFVLNNAKIGESLTGEWFEVIDGVLRMHSGYERKVNGLTYVIKVRKCKVNPKNRQFFIVRENKTSTDFSFYKAITQNTDKITRIKSTLRFAVAEQVKNFKDEYFENNAVGGYVVCSETKLKIRKKDSHLDHHPKSFEMIVKEWADNEGLSSEDIDLEYPKDDELCWPFRDKSLVNSFVEFHKVVAEYRVVLDKVNLQKPKGGRATF